MRDYIYGIALLLLGLSPLYVPIGVSIVDWVRNGRDDQRGATTQPGIRLGTVRAIGATTTTKPAAAGQAALTDFDEAESEAA